MSDTLKDLPDEVRELIESHVTATAEMLYAIGQVIAGKRDEAKTKRMESGIEDIWRACEDAYDGIDEVNRHGGKERAEKPMSITGPLTTGRMPRNNDYKSTAFVRLTARYVDAGAAKLGEILLPADDKAFEFSEMPVPELIELKKEKRQLHLHGVPLTRPAQPGEVVPGAGASPPAASGAPVPIPAAALGGAAGAAPPVGQPGTGAPAQAPGTAALPPLPPSAAQMPAPQAAPQQAPQAAPEQPPQVPLTPKDIAEEKIREAHEKAKAAETRIYDWMVDCQYSAEARKVIHDAARAGVGVLKGPVPRSKKEMVFSKSDEGGFDLVMIEKIKPSSKRVDFWNIFPDPACGENLHDGDYIFERDYMSRRQVANLKKLDGYISDQIDKVLDEGPDADERDTVNRGGGSIASKKGRFEVWYFYGTLKKEEMEVLSVAAGKSKRADQIQTDTVYVIVTLINDRVVKSTVNPLDSGCFPYDAVPWQRRDGHWAGVGVAEQVHIPQQIVNAATRAMLNNAGKSAGSQLVMSRRGIEPADGSWVITPDKIWFTTEDVEGRDVRQIMMAIQIPNMTDPMMKIIQYGLQLAEESTSIPLITQGMTGPTTPDTVGAANIQNTNANQLLRSIGYTFDDYVTEPHVRRYYEWLLLDPDVPDVEKGEFSINAHGSIALVERAIQDQTIAQMANLVLNPTYGNDPKKWMKQFLRSKRLDPALFQYTEEEQAKLDAAPPPDPPPVAVAKIQQDTALKELAAQQSTDQQTEANEQKIADAANTLEGHKLHAQQMNEQADAIMRLHEANMQHQRAILEYANRYKMNFDQVKSALARTAMELQTQRDLNAQDNATDTRMRPERPRRGMRPPDQVPGRAGNGRAFEQGQPQ